MTAEWSADGVWIAFTSDRISETGEMTESGRIMLIPAQGGSPRLITLQGSDIARWAPKGQTLLIYAVPADAWQDQGPGSPPRSKTTLASIYDVLSGAIIKSFEVGYNYPLDVDWDVVPTYSVSP